MIQDFNEYELYELIIQDDDDSVFALSLVEEPAIMQDFVYFNEDGRREIMEFATADAEQKTILGPILVPEMKILRTKKDGTPYYVTFSKDTVKRLAQKYIKDNNANNITIEHKDKVKDISLVESWVTESSQYDKSRTYGLTVKPGTWMGVFKVDNEDIWKNYVKTGKVKGISLEGLFTHELIKGSKIEDIFDKDINELSDDEAEVLLGNLRALIKKDKRFREGKRVEMESYSDYPDGVKNNAKRALEWVEKNGWGSCGTPVGKQRANQLAKGEPISVDTIKRMHSFLSRHEGDLESSKGFGDGCGYLMYQAWGGKAGLGWSRNRLRELGLLTETETQPSIPQSSYAGEPAGKKKPETDLAEVGPRGGIRKSPKAPKSDTPNRNPKGEGTAKGDASGRRGAKVSAEDEKTLENKVKEFNERDSNTKNGRATLGALKSVFQRGLGAYNASHSPRVSSPSQWAFARVNAFLYLLKNGRPENPKYDTDFDLLPKGHPKAR